jgi:NAD(P)-dependent dehydrogenase (short-subunit alcohol dehydrogenase family)
MAAMSLEASDLTGHVVIVTGGTRGIGLGIVRYLVRTGARLVITGRKPARLEAVAKELEAQGAPHVVMQADHGDREASRAVVQRAADAFGGIDALVANAQSYSPAARLEKVTEKDFDRVLDTGPKGTLWLMQAVLPHMKARGRGRIVTFGSATGHTGAAGYGAYAASKEGIRSLTRTAANEWGRFGITVNCVCPVSVAHRMPPTDDGGDRAAAYAAMFENHPLGRDGDPETDIAPVVAFLISDASQYLTGQTLMVDGGGTLRA